MPHRKTRVAVPVAALALLAPALLRAQWCPAMGPEQRPAAIGPVATPIRLRVAASHAGVGNSEVRVKLAERGILACLTNETEPQIALQRYLAGELPTQDPPLQTHPHGHAEDLAQPGRQNSGHGGCGHCHCGHAAGGDHDAMKTAP